MVGRVSRLKTWKNLTNITKKTVERMNKGTNKQMDKCVIEQRYKRKETDKLIMLVLMAVGALLIWLWGGV